MSTKVSLVNRIIIKLMRQAMGCKVEWSEEELRVMNNKVRS